MAALVCHIDLVGKRFSIKVPANTHNCFEALWKKHCQEHSRITDEAKARIMDQAERTAWKLVHEWIEIQLSMIMMRQAEWLEVFLPYVWDGRQTLFEHFRADKFKALPTPSEDCS